MVVLVVLSYVLVLLLPYIARVTERAGRVSNPLVGAVTVFGLQQAQQVFAAPTSIVFVACSIAYVCTGFFAMLILPTLVRRVRL